MSNKNFIEVEGNALNLSLTGSQLAHAKSNNRQSSGNVKKPPTFSNRSLTARSNSNSNLDQIKNQKDAANNSSTNSGRLNSAKNRNIPINWLSQKRAAEKENQNEKKVVRESNIFTPMSVRSSVEDDYDFAKKMTDFNNKNENTEGKVLELFFGKDNQKENNYLESKSQLGYDSISPLKDEKLMKLKSSVDNLRKTLQNETAINDDEEVMKRVNNTKNKLAAIKIQTWYRNLCSKRNLHHKNEMEKLFNKKKIEMKKKLVNDNIYEYNKTHLANKKKVTKDNFNSNLNKKNEEKNSLITNEENSPRTLILDDDNQSIKTSRSNERKELKQPSNVKNSKDSLINFSRAHNLKEHNNASNDLSNFKATNTNATTVESLLFNLEKIEKESMELLKPEKQKCFNDTDSSISNQKVNSILSFLDEASTNDANNFVPKAFKDYKLDLSEYNFSIDKKNSLTPPMTPKRPTNASSSFKNRTNTEQNTNRSNNSHEDTTTPKSIGIKKTTKKNISNSITKLNAIKNQEDDETSKNSFSNETELNEQLMAYSLEIEEKKRTIAMLEKALSQQRELTIRHTQEADKEMQIRLEVQKNDYESTIQRHLGFIDQLIDDKKILSEKCEKLVKELKDVEKTYSDKFRTTEERYKIEIQKVKDTFEAAEKLRREKWIEEKTKKIKEMTVKGLEPEIQGLITKHKNEIKTLKAIHDAELLQADERASQRYIRITEELRENYEREKEASIQKEREISKQRYEKSLEDEEKSFLEQRRRLYAEIEEEKNRIAEQGAFQRRELDRLRKMLEENNLSSIETIKKEYSQSQADMEKKHQTELQNLKEKLEIEKQSWEQNYLKKQDNWSIQKEREIKDQLRRERDKEIEMLITRLETESTSLREESERAAENRIKRIRDKYESELKEVEKTERETMERFNTLKAKYNELEGEHERLKVICRQKEKDMEGIKKLTDTLQEERNRLADVIRQDFSDRLIFTEEENKRVKLEMAELKSRHQHDLDKKKEEFEKLQKEKAEELDTVHEKIKQVLAKKDETVNQLKQQYDAACKRADHLEGLLEQQRTLMLKKQSNS